MDAQKLAWRAGQGRPGGSQDGVLAAVAAALQVQRPTPDAAFTVKVDGTSIEAEPRGSRARLTCVLAEASPPEDALRALMADYLRYADHGAEVLCSDAAGRVLLIAELGTGDDIPARTRDFCDAAVHWTRRAGRLDAPPAAYAPMPATLIFP